MDYIEISFTAELGEIDSGFRRTGDEMFILINPSAAHFQQIWRPPVDVCETPDEILILAEIAGVSKKDIHVEISHRRVKIFGRRRERHIEGNTSYCLAEIPYGYFERNLALLVPIEMGAVSATYTD